MANRIHKVDLDFAKKNLNAILKYHSKISQTNQKSQLFEEHANVLLQIDFCMKPSVKNKSYFFKVPKSPIFDQNQTEICLITTDDKKFQAKHEKAKYEQRDRMKREISKNCPFVMSVLPMSVVKSDYKTFESKRLLCQSYDMFVAERAVFHELPKVLGSYFIKQKKMPRKIEKIDTLDTDLKSKLINKCKPLLWFVDGRGTCTSLNLGKVNWPITDLQENLKSVLEQVAKVTPRGWNFIKTVHIRVEGANGAALEIYKKGDDIDVPLEKSDIEKRSIDRNFNNTNELFKLYENLIRNKIKKKETVEAVKTSKRKIVSEKVEEMESPTKKIKADES